MPTCNAAYLTECETCRFIHRGAILSADSLLHWTLRERLRVELRFVPR